jgi:hypothetical protein
MPDLNDILKKVWPKVKKRHLFPELPAPECADGELRAGLNIIGKKISISKKFVEEMSVVLEPREILEGLLDHAVSHYIYCPWSLATQLKLYAEAKTVLKDKEMALRAADCFMDVVADTLCVSQKETPLPKIYRHLERSILDEAIHALYQRIWDMDLGVHAYEDLSNRLSRIPYWDRSRWLKGIRRFAKLIKPLLEMEKDYGNLDTPLPMGCHSIQQYSSQEIEEGLKELAFDAASPSDFTKTVHDFEDEISLAIQPAGQGPGLASARSMDMDVLYYMKLAENYMLPIRKAPMEKSGSIYPHHHINWEVSQPYQDIDPWTSLGKFMPGITQTWKRREGEVFGKEEGIPDCLVIIDSSGSMQNLRHGLSYAVLGAACACDAYLRNDAQVAVYNFGDASAGGRQILPYSRQRKEIYATLCRYFAGGTKFFVEDIEALQMNRVPDIFLISDMQITNLELLIQYFNNCKNRVTVVHIGNNEHVNTFRCAMELRKNVEIYAVEKKADILGIVLGKVRQYLY